MGEKPAQNASSQGERTGFTFLLPVGLLCFARLRLGVLNLMVLAQLLFLPSLVRAQFDYTTNNGAVTIRTYTGPGGAVTIPNTIDGLPVTSIGPSSFSGAWFGAGVTSVAIPDSVTNIGEQAFIFCGNLTNVSLGNGVTNIGDFAFSGCVRLLTIDAGSSNPAFSSTNGVLFDKDQTILVRYPSGVAGSYAIPNTVRRIGREAFLVCRGLTELSIPNGVSMIGDYAFDQSGLTNITIPESVKSIGSFAFEWCSSLTGITLGPGVTTIGSYAFNYCTSLTSLTIPNGVAMVGPNIFENCSSLTNLFLGTGLTNFPIGSMNACVSMTTITVDPLNSHYSSLDGVLFNKDQTVLMLCPQRKAGSYTVPSSVDSIAGDAFATCTNLSNITISGSVSNIGAYAFYSCSGLSSITIPDSVISISPYAFSTCTSLTNVTVGTNLLYLPAVAFYNCYYLSMVYFKGNAPFVDPSAFAGDNIATIYFLPGTTGWAATFGGRPTVLLNPLISTNDTTFGIRTNLFGFNLTWGSGQIIVLEACTNLARPIWIPLETNTLASSPTYFGDLNWIDYPARFYRFRSLLPTNPPPPQIFKTLHYFGGDGLLDGGVTLSGNVLYGTTSSGGAVFAIHTDGTGFIYVHDLGGPAYAGVSVSSNTIFGTTGGGGAFANGSVFRVNTDGTDFTNLYSFTARYATLTNIDGVIPWADLTLSDDVLYGTTLQGGYWAVGTIFRINTDGTGFTNLHNFTGGTGGATPYAGLISLGNTLYGTTAGGGISNNGTVFSIGTDGTGFTNLYSFSGGSDGGSPCASLIMWSNTLYGTTAGGGNSNAGTLFAIRTDGSGFTTLYSFTGGSDGANPNTGLVLSGTKLYGTAIHGGRWGSGTVFSVNTDGTGFTTLHTFSPLSGSPPINDDGAAPTGALVSGNIIFGTTQWGGHGGYGTVFSISLP